MAFFSKKSPDQKSYNKATHRLRMHIIDESINPIPGSEMMEEYVAKAADEAAAAWWRLHADHQRLEFRDAEAIAINDVFVHPSALNGENRAYAIEVMGSCQAALASALLRYQPAP